MANGKRGRPMTAVDVKLNKLLSDTAYIQQQVAKDERMTVAQRPGIDAALLNIGNAIAQALVLFKPSDSVQNETTDVSSSDYIEAATPDTATGESEVSNIEPIDSQKNHVTVDGKPLDIFSSAAA